MSKVLAVCHTSCRDGQRNMVYYRGQTAPVEPMEPLAAYFTFPPGTKKYSKKAEDGFELEGENTFFPPVVQEEEEDE